MNNKWVRRTMTANMLSFLAHAIEMRSEDDREAVSELLEDYGANQVGDLKLCVMPEVGEILLDMLVQDKPKDSDFSGVPVDMLGIFVAEKADEDTDAEADAEADAVYPHTPQEKLGYAQYFTVTSLEHIAKALTRFERLRSLSAWDLPTDAPLPAPAPAPASTPTPALALLLVKECDWILRALCRGWADLNEARLHVKELMNGATEMMTGGKASMTDVSVMTTGAKELTTGGKELDSHNFFSNP